MPEVLLRVYFFSKCVLSLHQKKCRCKLLTHFEKFKVRQVGPKFNALRKVRYFFKVRRHTGGIKIEQNIENPASALASGCFWSKLLLQKRKGLLILFKKCWKPFYAVCEVLVILIRQPAKVKNAHRGSTL